MNCDQSLEKSNIAKSSESVQAVKLPSRASASSTSSSKPSASGSVLSLDKTQQSEDGARPLEEADIPGFEYELPENIGADNGEEAILRDHLNRGTPSNEAPRFDEHRHPATKFFVRMIGVVTILAVIVQGVRNFSKYYTHFTCYFMQFGYDSCELTYDAPYGFFEMTLYAIMEIIFPTFAFSLYFLAKFSCFCSPRIEQKMVRTFFNVVMFVELIALYHCLSLLSSSMAMLSSLSTTIRQDIWLDYIRKTTYGLMWMYGFFNLFIFVKLLHFDRIRQREMNEIRRNNGQQIGNI